MKPKTLVWGAGFVRAFNRLVRRDPGARERVEDVLQRLSQDPFHPTLHTHKLKGKLSGAWACTVDYDNRILFEIVHNAQSHEDEIFLLALGTHDEVY